VPRFYRLALAACVRHECHEAGLLNSLLECILLLRTSPCTFAGHQLAGRSQKLSQQFNFLKIDQRSIPILAMSVGKSALGVKSTIFLFFRSHRYFDSFNIALATISLVLGLIRQLHDPFVFFLRHFFRFVDEEDRNAIANWVSIPRLRVGSIQPIFTLDQLAPCPGAYELLKPDIIDPCHFIHAQPDVPSPSLANCPMAKGYCTRGKACGKLKTFYENRSHPNPTIMDDMATNASYSTLF